MNKKSKHGKWELPTKEVLNELFKNRENIGGFDDGNYWSSSEYSSSSAWRQSFASGYQGAGNKYGAVRVRPVRALPEGHEKTERVFSFQGIDYQAYPEDAPNPMMWQEAKAYCEGLNSQEDKTPNEWKTGRKRPKPKAIYCEIESERLVVLFDDFKAQESYCDHLEKRNLKLTKRMTELEGKLANANLERSALKKKLEEAQEILKIGEVMRE